LHDALTRVQQNGLITAHPLHSQCAAISVGIHNGQPILDLPYVEDSSAEVDMNVVMLQPVAGGEPSFVEVQGTAEGKAFTRGELDDLLGLAAHGLGQIFTVQRNVLSTAPTPRTLGR
jgi:ribonuclease PH